MNGSGGLTLIHKAQLPSYLPTIAYSQIQSDSCISLSKIVLPGLSEPSGWSVTFDGRNYVYLVLFPSQTSFGIQPRLTGSASSLSYNYNWSASVLRIDLILAVSSAKKYSLDLSPLDKLSSRITFYPPEGIHTGIDIRSNRLFLIARQNMSDFTLSGFYSQELPDLSARSVSMPFELSIHLKNGENVAIGPELSEAMVSSAVGIMNDDRTFLNDTRVLAPDITDRFEQARLDLEDFELEKDQVAVSNNTFPLERSLKLILEAHDEIRALIFSSSLLVAPVTLVIVFILGAIGSHLFFNGSKGMTLVLFAAFYFLAFQVHPGLRLFALASGFWFSSNSSPYGTSSFVLLMFSSNSSPYGSSSFVFLMIASCWFSLLMFLAGALLVFRYSGTRSIYSLAASNAVRTIKRRKLRGALAIVTVAVIAMATVPSITLKTVVPIVSDVKARPLDGKNIVCLWNSWSLLVAIYGQAGITYYESAGFFTMGYDEAVFDAMKLGLEEYTPLCISAYNSPKLRGSIIFANLTFLSHYLGLELNKSVSTGDDAYTIFVDRNLFPQDEPSPSWLAVEGVSLKVAGTFEASTLLMPNGDELEDYLRANELFIGVPDQGTVMSPPADLLAATNRTSGKFSIPVPIIGVADIRAVKDVLPHNRVILIIGTHSDEKTLPGVEDYLRSLISSDKVSLIWSLAGGQVVVRFVSSYSAMMARGSFLETIRAGFPVSMALGTWYSQLILMSIGILIILAAILNSTYERRKEAVTMSSLGASPSFITYSFVAEGLMIGVMGGCTGYILGYIWAYWIGMSSPEIATELYSITPLLLVLLTSMVVTLLGSVFPAREALLRVVPSKVMLSKEIGYVKVEKDGSRKVPIPIRLREDQLEHFSSFLSNMVRYYSATKYGVTVRSHERVANGEKLLVDYRGPAGPSERFVAYEVEINYAPIGDSYHVQLVIRSPEEKWTVNHQAVMKDMVYDLRDELLKITLSRHWNAD
jgi:hypothetical protein